MKGLILAAGRGTRLHPLTDRRSKPLVPVANRPLITYALDKLARAGIRDIGIVVGDNADELRAGLRYDEAQLTFIRQPEPLGLAHAVSFAREFTGDSDFALLFCDNLFSEPLDGALREWDELKLELDGQLGALLHTYEMPDPRACGVAVVEDGWVAHLEEKPAEPRSNHAVVGIDILTPAIYDAIGRIKPSARGELEITDAMAELIAMGHRVRARPLAGFWFDTGTLRDLVHAQGPVIRELSEAVIAGSFENIEYSGKVSIEPGCQIADARLEGPLLIGRDCSIERCNLGPNVAVGDGCELSDCELSDCMLLPGTSLSGVEASWVVFDGAARIELTLGEPEAGL